MNSKNGEKSVSSLQEFNFVPPVPISEDKDRKGKFEAAAINAGALAAYTVSYGVSRAVRFTVNAIKNIRSVFVPGWREVTRTAAGKLKGSARSVVKGIESVLTGFRIYGRRIKDDGFFKATACSVRDAAEFAAVKKNAFKTAFNYAVPVASIVFLVAVVRSTAATNYGIAVEYNGTEIGVVSEESIIADAQQVISDKNVYYSIDDAGLVSTNLSIKPLNSMDEVIDEVELVQKMQEQLDTVLPEADMSAMTVGEPVFEPLTSEQDVQAALDSLPADEMDGKVRAYTVYIDGELYAAVDDISEIDEYINSVKDPYLSDPNVVSVGFDKEVEYSYEQFVSPSQIVPQEDIINKLQSIVSEPVYYEVANGDNPWNIASHNGLTLDELLDCPVQYEGEEIDDLSEYCPVGAVIQLSEEVPYLRTLVTKEETYEVTLDYDVETTEDENLYKGEQQVDVPGVEGSALVTALVTYKGGVAVSRSEQSREVLSEPVTKKVRVGTRPTTTEVSTGSGGSGDYFWPVDGGYISAYMGDGRGHKGIDIAAPYGTPIYAAASGTVTRAANKYDGYGNSVMVANDDGNVTMYAHMSSIAISYGDYVVKGQLLGYVGATGYATGNHLHFEVRSNGYYLDPLDYVSQN